MCSGYYDYDKAHSPYFPGSERFAGTIVHPQFWPATLDYKGKNVVIIGSGATAVTLVPEMAKRAASVTMLQRSPTYIVSRPAQDRVANWLRTKLPAKTAYGADALEERADGHVLLPHDAPEPRQGEDAADRHGPR